MGGPVLLGVEIGGTKLQLGLGRGDGALVAVSRRKIIPSHGARGILDQISAALPELLESAGLEGDRPRAVGIGFGGPVDVARGTVVRSHHIEGWDGFDLAAWVRSDLGIPWVAVQNDADVAGLGEARHGAGAGLSPIFYVTIGSGIGGGLIIDGRIYRGAGLGASEIGHLWVDPDGAGPRRLEDLASGWSIGSIARSLPDFAERSPSEIDAEFIAAEARRGHLAATGVLQGATLAISHALGHLVTLLAPRRIILGGGVSLIEDRFWLGPIRSATRERAFPPFRDSFDIVSAQLGQDVVIHGALALALEHVESLTTVTEAK